MKTIDNIEINKALLWDYKFTEDELNTQFFADWYLARVLNNGNYSDVKNVPINLIRLKFDKIHLSRKVRFFCEWYFK